MNMESMKTPRTRAEFERHFNLLHRQIKDDKLCLPVDFILDSLARVRFLPNGRIDFLSVDENARLQANTTAQFSEDFFQEQLKAQGTPKISADGPDGDASPPVSA